MMYDFQQFNWLRNARDVLVAELKTKDYAKRTKIKKDLREVVSAMRKIVDEEIWDRAIGAPVFLTTLYFIDVNGVQCMERGIIESACEDGTYSVLRRNDGRANLKTTEMRLIWLAEWSKYLI